MRTSRADGVLVLVSASLALALTACGNNGSGKPLAGGSTAAGSTTSPVASHTTHTATSPISSQATPSSPVARPTPTPTPTPSPTPTPTTTPSGSASSNFLHVACTNDTVTTLTLDPVTGAPSHPVDTALDASGSFTPSALAADATGDTLFVTGATGLMAVGLKAGVLTPPAASSTTNPVNTTSPGATGVVVLPGSGVALTADQNAYSGGGSVTAFTSQASASGIALEDAATFSIGTLGGPASLALDSTGATVYTANPIDANVRSAKVTLSGTTVTFGKPTAAKVDPAWANGFGVGPNVCVLVTGTAAGATSPTTALLTGNGDGSISAFPVTAPSVLAAGTTVYTPSAALVNGNGCVVSGIAVDATGEWLVISDSSANQVFGFTVAFTAAGKVTLTSVGPGALSAATPAVCFHGSLPVVYTVSNQSQNQAVSAVSALEITATGFRAIGTVALPSVDDVPAGLAVSR